MLMCWFIGGVTAKMLWAKCLRGNYMNEKRKLSLPLRGLKLIYLHIWLLVVCMVPMAKAGVGSEVISESVG